MKPTIPSPSLCLVTDRHLCGQRVDKLEDKVAAAVKGGVNLVQLREKDLPSGQLIELAVRLRKATSGSALLFINDRLDVALACHADGVQLGEGGFPVQAARQLAGDRLLIGRSVHSVEGAIAAEMQGADLLIVGTIFASSSHLDGRPAGTGLLSDVARSVTIPFAGIGGITTSSLGQVVGAGAAGVALISAILAAEDAERAARELKRGLEDAWSEYHTGVPAEAEVGKAPTRSA